MSLTRAALIRRADRVGGGRSLRKEIRRYFNTPKRDRGLKWVYGIETLFAMELPTGQLKSFAEIAGSRP